MKNKFFLITVLAFAVFGFSNLKAQQAAQQFKLNQRDSASRDVVYFCCTDRLILTNDNINRMNLDLVDSATGNELIRKYTHIVDKVNDSIILSTFRNGLLSKLRSYGFEVVEVKREDMPKQFDIRHHTVEVAQLELEEYSFVDSVSTMQGEHRAMQKMLNGIRLNAWIVYNGEDTNSMQMFFCDEQMTDEFHGFVEKESGKYYANYTLTKINPNDAYILSDYTAKVCARYFFNFLINRYVWFQTGGQDKNYYGINEDNELMYDSSPFDNFDIITQED